jgi:hypothetical protein
MDTDQPPPEQRAFRDQMREITGALAAGLPAESLPREPVAPGAVRELAADLAAQILDQMAQPAAGTPEEEVEGFARRLPFNCPNTFNCSGYYACPGIGAHSCNPTFGCGTTFSCTQVFFGYRGITAR